MNPVLARASTSLLRTQSDERLVELARAGHERAFEAIVERYRRPLLRACRRVLPEARAEDAVQHAFLNAWSALRSGAEVRELRPWLYRIAQNAALGALRASGFEYDELQEALRPVEAPQEELERRAIVRDTLAGLAQLPERQREALLRIAVEGRPQEEVAREMGLSDGAVRQLVFRARSTLRAAAAAVTPLPFVAWLASAHRGQPLAQRIAELASTAGAGGAAAVAAKTSVVAVLGGAAVGGPALIETGERERSRPVARAASPAPAPANRPLAADFRGAASGTDASPADAQRGADRLRTKRAAASDASERGRGRRARRDAGARADEKRGRGSAHADQRIAGDRGRGASDHGRAHGGGRPLGSGRARHRSSATAPQRVPRGRGSPAARGGRRESGPSRPRPIRTSGSRRSASSRRSFPAPPARSRPVRRPTPVPARPESARGENGQGQRDRGHGERSPEQRNSGRSREVLARPPTPITVPE